MGYNCRQGIMKKHLFYYLALALLCCACESNHPENSTTEQEFLNQDLVLEDYCGERGDNVKYKVYANGYDLTVIVYGEGAMRSYSSCPLKNLEDKDYKIVAARVEEGITYFGSNFFSGLEYLTKVSLPNSIKMYEDGAFSGCGIDTIVIPSGEIGRMAFHGCKSLRCCIIGNKVTRMDYSAFGYCSKLDSIDFGEAITSIGPSAFQWCTNLKKCNIGNSVTEIGQQSFEFCQGLENIIIGTAVTDIGWAAFKACTNFNSMTCFAPTPPVLGSPIDRGDDFIVYVPVESVDLYKNNDSWKVFNIQPIPSNN